MSGFGAWYISKLQGNKTDLTGKGDVKQKGFEGWLELLGLQNAIKVQTDLVARKITASPTFHPWRVVMPISSVLPQLNQMIAESEQIKLIEVQYWSNATEVTGRASAGKLTKTMTYTFEDSYLTALAFDQPVLKGREDARSLDAFVRLEWVSRAQVTEHNIAGTIATFDFHDLQA